MTKSSNDTHMTEDGEKPKPRRFAPQVVEESHSTSKKKEQEKPHVKFKPEVISTIYSSNRKAKGSQDSDSSSAMDIDEKGRRKFTPILLDTARRSRKAGDDKPAISDSHKTEYAYHLHTTEHWNRVHQERAGPSGRPEPKPAAADSDIESDHGSAMSTDSGLKLREVCPLDGSAPKRSACAIPARTHSFRMPDLDTIESSESEPDTNPSPLSASPTRDGSPITASESSFEYFKHATRIRESVDENFTHYLLDLERKKARKRMEEQALAAYPNPGFGYEAPDHYINNDDESDQMELEDRPVTWEGNDDDLFGMKKPRHRDSTGVNWEQLEMQQHAEEMQQERNANRVTAKAAPSPWWKPGAFGIQREAEPNSELKSMRDRARPPMLGGDIVFPRCPSPEPARFDVTQGSVALRNQMCYLQEAAESERHRTGEDGGLWQASPSPKSPVLSVRSPVVSVDSSQSKGLWGGFCVDSGDKTSAANALSPPPAPSGLMTPANELANNPFDVLFTAEQRPHGMKTPRAPRANAHEADFAHLNAVLVSERDFEAQLDEQYPDSFITQVYNYLSLGYPALARPFDDELAKISRVPVEELRQDDVTAKQSPRGYIRLGTDFEGGGGDGVSGMQCVRWQALRMYIREWARQARDGHWEVDEVPKGTTARRGSWAF